MLLLIERYILAIQLIITHEERLQYFFWSSELSQKSWHYGHKNRKWLKQPQSHFHRAISQKSHQFFLFWCMLYTTIPDIPSSSENINSTARVSKLSLSFLWLWTKVDSLYSSWEAILSGVPQGYIPVLLLFNISTYFTGYADENTLFVIRDNITDVKSY